MAGARLPQRVVRIKTIRGIAQTIWIDLISLGRKTLKRSSGINICHFTITERHDSSWWYRSLHLSIAEAIPTLSQVRHRSWISRARASLDPLSLPLLAPIRHPAHNPSTYLSPFLISRSARSASSAACTYLRSVLAPFRVALLDFPMLFLSLRILSAQA